MLDKFSPNFRRKMVALTLAMLPSISIACTGIKLMANDGSVVYGRTMEWGAFDLNSRVAIIPRNVAFQGTTPDGKNGKKWVSKYGVVGLDLLEKNTIADGMNEVGLTAGLFYHPGFAQYPDYEPSNQENTITGIDLVHYVLTQFSTVKEAVNALSDIQVVAVIEKSIGIPVEAHFIITEPSGASAVIEFNQGEMKVFDNKLGVITNAPNYDWHLTNLRNYINLSPVALPNKALNGEDFAPLGGGSGMIGLPGDFTPPSRFVRAVAFSQNARPTETSSETVYELFRILDGFNLGAGAAEGSGLGNADTESLRSATLWTTASDMQNKVFYYHTQHNRRVRSISLASIDFSTMGPSILHLPLDKQKRQDIVDLTPLLNRDS
ncbi:choloylglycine hydrolase family protein [Vibrio sp. D420a]|uniref:choloylglycine hydrolase family protein n=1 Tax=Vibrio sp. D420a TaxID=2836895 RepID=UPI0025537114|nr:choloylglycine hydrolase family protein [Vibrio sp. D420a]MDK9764703.1 choloylglycine hydrolase family protein [Vibrio sp. D420a]